MEMGKWRKMGAAVVVAIAIAIAVGLVVGNGNRIEIEWNKERILSLVGEWSEKLGIWGIPAYVAIHTLTLSLCLPYAVFFEAAASVLFGFFPALICVFSAKVLAASLSFTTARMVFRRRKSCMEWILGNKYFKVISKGVETDGWKFVLLARFSPLPSYIINYTLAATNVSFFIDFLIPTVIGCIPMILHNISIGTLASAALSHSFSISSYLFPFLGILSTILISLRINSYSSRALSLSQHH